tara:strand:- start:416 stop:841 length:426 start_codon:yes stop_codon:yes gene_type:complete
MSEEMDLLLKALENDNNECVFKLTSKQINDMKIQELSELSLSKDHMIKLLTELKDYVFIFELPEMKPGSFVRWISLNDPSNIRLTKGAIIVDILISSEGLVLKCKNYKNKFFHVNTDKVLLFRKLNNQEKILISVSNYLNK